MPCSLLAQETANIALTLSPGLYYHEVTAGKDNLFSLEVRNTGDIALTDIRLSADVNRGWLVQFTPDVINPLSVGDLQTVEVNIKPQGTVIKGWYYDLSITAEANEITVVENIQIEVKSSPFWMWVGVGVAAVAVVAFVFVYIRFNKQRN